MAAFGMPRPALLRIGFDNGNSHEFGGTRSGDAQTIDGLGSWQDIASTMKVGDTWTVNFNTLRDEAGLAQILSVKSLPDSATATIEPRLNGQSLGERRIAKNGRAFWPVPKNLIVEGGMRSSLSARTAAETYSKWMLWSLAARLAWGRRRKAVRTIKEPLLIARLQVCRLLRIPTHSIGLRDFSPIKITSQISISACGLIQMWRIRQLRGSGRKLNVQTEIPRRQYMAMKNSGFM
jgi:hypothetical protein